MTIENIDAILWDLEEYFDDKADADYLDNQIFPNREMQLLKNVVELREYFDNKLKDIIEDACYEMFEYDVRIYSNKERDEIIAGYIQSLNIK